MKHVNNKNKRINNANRDSYCNKLIVGSIVVVRVVTKRKKEKKRKKPAAAELTTY